MSERGRHSGVAAARRKRPRSSFCPNAPTQVLALFLRCLWDIFATKKTEPNIIIRLVYFKNVRSLRWHLLSPLSYNPAAAVADVAAEMEAVTDRLAGGGSGRPRADLHVVWLELADQVARLAADHAALAAAAAAAAEAEAVAAKAKGPVLVKGLATLGGMADGRGFDRQAYTHMQSGESW